MSTKTAPIGKRIVILGGGTGGTLTANRLRRELDESCTITVVDQDNDHIYQPGLLFVPFKMADPDDIVRRRDRQLHRGVTFVDADIERVRTLALEARARQAASARASSRRAALRLKRAG